MKKPRPIEIPSFFTTDRATRRLITAWIHHHQRFHVCRRRINWKTKEARELEKKRRREKWRRLAQILDIERTLIHWLAKDTHHPDIWTSKNIDKPESTLRQLEREYFANRIAAHNATGIARKRLLARREAIVTSKRAIERAWMVALVSAVDPTLPIPPPLELHPRELLPRKLARASRELLAELT